MIFSEELEHCRTVASVKSVEGTGSWGPRAPIIIS
jgi:hypothetical protein